MVQSLPTQKKFYWCCEDRQTEHVFFCYERRVGTRGWLKDPYKPKPVGWGEKRKLTKQPRFPRALMGQHSENFLQNWIDGRLRCIENRLHNEIAFT